MGCKEYDEVIDRAKSWLRSEMDKGMEACDGSCVMNLSDVIKDMECAKKDHLEACYYKTVIAAMNDGDDGNESEWPAGYNHRHMSNGQFASKSSGRYGFKPYMDQMPYIMDYMDDRSTYSNYKNARRNYTVTNNDKYRDEMDTNALNYIDEIMTNVKSMYDESDPELQRVLMNNLKEAVNRMAGSKNS